MNVGLKVNIELLQCDIILWQFVVSYASHLLCSFLLRIETKTEKANDEKDRLLLKKMEESDTKAVAQQKVFDLMKGQDECKEEFSTALVQVILRQQLWALFSRETRGKYIFLYGRTKSCKSASANRICRKS